MRAVINVPDTPLAQGGVVLGVFFTAFLMGTALAELLLRMIRRIASRPAVHWDDGVAPVVRGPVRLLCTFALTGVLEQAVELEPRVEAAVDRVIQMASILAATWLGVRLVGVLASLLEERATRRAQARGDALGARGVQTQLTVLRRVLAVAVAVFGVALLLLQFEAVRSVGVSVLASAGVAGIVLGFAAQKSLGTLFGGLQLSITQPIRLGDSVVLDGEFGTIEELNLSHVVVKLWDQRRLIVPVHRFLDEAFQNWTRQGTELLGTVSLRLDYGIRVDAIRAKLDELLQGHKLWDGRVKGVQVTDNDAHTVEVRILVSADDAGSLFDLRCDLRERLLAWLAEHEGGRYLPRSRFEAKELPTAARDTRAGGDPARDRGRTGPRPAFRDGGRP